MQCGFLTYRPYSQRIPGSGNRRHHFERVQWAGAYQKDKAHPIGVPVLVLSMHDESLYAERALRAGATGYITKHEAADNVLLAIRRVLAGEVYLSGTMTSVFLRSFTTGLKSMPRPLDRLTDRERL